MVNVANNFRVPFSLVKWSNLEIPGIFNLRDRDFFRVMGYPEEKPSLLAPPQFNTSVPHKKHSFSAPTSLSTTPKSPQFHIPLSFTPKSPQFNTVLSEGWVKLRGFKCGTEGFLVWNWGLFGVKLRDFGGWKGVDLLCGTDLLNWEGFGTEGYPF